MISETDLLEMVARGENSTTEFKDERFQPDSLAKEIVAFCNASGGTLLIGVADDGTITGTETKKTEERVINICRNNIVPPIIPQIYSIKNGLRWVMAVVIEKGHSKPYKVRASNKYYIRAGSASVEPTQEELIRLFQDGVALHFEISKLPGTSMRDLNLVAFQQYCQKFRNIDTIDSTEIPTVLNNWQLIADDGCLTVAGALLFAHDPMRHLPQSGIELHAFSGTDQTSQILDRKDIRSAIPLCLEDALRFINIHSPTAASIDSDNPVRVDTHAFEPSVVRELIVNAAIHRDWSIFGQRIRVQIFSDRLEVFSPGRLPNTLTLARACAGISYYRNPLLAQIIADFRWSERMGRGIMRALQLCRSQGISPPEFEVTPDFVRVVLPRHS